MCSESSVTKAVPQQRVIFNPDNSLSLQQCSTADFESVSACSCTHDVTMQLECISDVAGRVKSIGNAVGASS